MSYGILITNTSGNIIVSSDITSLHFVGKAQYIGQVFTGLSDFPAYTPDNNTVTLSGCTIYRYGIYCPYGTPVFFIKPGEAVFHGILNQYKSGNYWYVEIIKNNQTPITIPQPRPTIYVFGEPSNITTTDTQGLLVTKSDGITATFDSRKNPLAIYAAASMRPPQIPCDGGTPVAIEGGFYYEDSVLDFNFKSNNTYTQTSMPTTVALEHLMFSAPSPAQAVYSRQKNGYKISTAYAQPDQPHYSSANWWVMYHQQYGMTNGILYAGWGPYAAGYAYSAYWESGGWFGGGSGSISSGTRPYTDKTINWAYNTIIVVDSRAYTGAEATGVPDASPPAGSGTGSTSTQPGYGGYTPPVGGGGGGSVSVTAFLPMQTKLAGQVVYRDTLLLLSTDRKGTKLGEVSANRISTQNLLTLVSESGIRLTCSDNTPLTLEDGSLINSTLALDNKLPVQDKNGFRWEKIIEVLDAGVGQVATISCKDQCYGAGDEPNKWIWTHNLMAVK